MQKGFLSFFIVLFFGLLFINQLNISATFNEFNASEKTLLEIEKTNFLRTELEINFDHFVKEFLSASLGGSTTVELLNSNFAQSLNNFIGMVEQNSGANFYICNCGKNFYKSASSQPKTRLNLGELQSLFKVSFNPFEQNKIGLEFLDNKTPKFLFAEIKTQNHSDVFIVPINYSVGEKN